MPTDPSVPSPEQREARQLRCAKCGRPYVNTAACCDNPKKQEYEPNRDPEE